MTTNAIIGYRLVQIGIDPGSADFWWSKYTSTQTQDLELRTSRASKNDIPAWTLSSLFNMLPDYIDYEQKLYHWEYSSVPPGWRIRYITEDGEVLIESENPDQFEAVFHMLMWLYESGFELNERYLYLK